MPEKREYVKKTNQPLVEARLPAQLAEPPLKIDTVVSRKIEFTKQ